MSQSVAELTLATQLEQAGIPFEREYRFASEEWCLANDFITDTGRPKRWRADFAIDAKVYVGAWPIYYGQLLIEIDGGGFIAGRHSRGAGMEKDAEKASAAAILGYRVIRATPSQVEDGRALGWIRQALGLEVAA